MDFDKVIERRGTHCMKWDMMEHMYGVPSDEGIAMWVADMDFLPPEAARSALQSLVGHGIYGYYGDDRDYRKAICWWMDSRHGWNVEPEWIHTVHGLVNGTALCIDAFSSPGDGIVLFTPVYHAFARVIRAAGRRIVECPLEIRNERYAMNFANYDALMSGEERLAILCSPHNPGGTVWSRDELREVAEFCERHDLVLVSDEIHHDLVLPGRSHTPMPLAVPSIANRLVMMTATTKSFNIAGAHCGNVIIQDEALRKTFARKITALGISPNSFGMFLAEALYSPEGAAWIDAVVQYIEENCSIFDTSINGIAGLKSMPLDATYLAWVDFSGTGLPPSEFTRRVEQEAKIAVNHGPTFGSGGENFLRFNLATPRSLVERAIERLDRAFKF
ncbi:MAG: pyridoxal phosphate-dependent aminotransferase [Albidovulum sp.]|nr:pyridoxal phosphate-dependent aminotransferase [Albidovulum sp.]MDE0307202.1 pyridoxal phosphate-dependent aminotransferase [Albidovulum sp.]MDE0531930.1 pyridoxal phosphate-dependent aminotransferase [Albidovulum sp.]